MRKIEAGYYDYEGTKDYDTDNAIKHDHAEIHKQYSDGSQCTYQNDMCDDGASFI